MDCVTGLEEHDRPVLFHTCSEMQLKALIDWKVGQNGALTCGNDL